TQRSSIPAGPFAAAQAGRVLLAGAVIAMVLLAALLLLRSQLPNAVIALPFALALAYAIDALRRIRRQLADRTEAARRVAERASRLQRLSAAMLGRVGAAGVATLIVEEGRQAVGASAAAVVVARENASAEIVAAHGFRDEVLNRNHEMYKGPTPLMDALESGEA